MKDYGASGQLAQERAGCAVCLLGNGFKVQDCVQVLPRDQVDFGIRQVAEFSVSVSVSFVSSVSVSYIPSRWHLYLLHF